MTGSAARRKTVVSWSSGKDSAHTLYRLRNSPDHEVVGLLTTVTEPFDRVSMHGVRVELLRAQARAAGLPLHVVSIPYPCPNAEYEARMGEAVGRLHAAGVTQVAFGDLFLEDVRNYRMARLAGTGVSPIFPLWGEDTRALGKEMIDSGLRARLVCLDPVKMDRAFAGREFDRRFLEELPASVDPCGERGEFHTFVTDSPAFARPVTVSLGAVVERDGFVFQDLMPAEPPVGGPTPGLRELRRD